MSVVVPFALLLGVAPVSFRLLRGGERRLHSATLFSLQIAILLVPWLLPSGYPFVRFCAALCSVLAFVRIWETRVGVLPEQAKRHWTRYVSYFLCVPDICFSNTDEQRHRAFRAGWWRAGRALLKAIAVVALLAMATRWPAWHDSLIYDTVWCLWAAYFASSGVADLAAGMLMILTGHGAQEMFREPPLAHSPRDFWGRRWNLMFRNAAHRLIFMPLGGSRHLIWTVSAVFLFSAAAHEYLVFAALGSSSGHMFAFFGLHCLATLACGAWPQRWAIPRAVAVALHLGWLVMTAPLFFVPLKQVIDIGTLALW